MNQRFEGQVEQVAAGDIHNHSNPFGRLLTKAERASINASVRGLDDEFGEPSAKTWRYLHQTVGFDGIDEMCIGHLMTAEEILRLLRKSLEQEKALDAAPVLQPSPAGHESDGKDALSAELKKARGDCARLRRELSEAREKASAFEARSIDLELKANRTEAMISKLHDQLAIYKTKDLNSVRKIRRQRVFAGFMMLMTAGSLYAAFGPSLTDLEQDQADTSAKALQEAAQLPHKKGR